MSSANGGPRPTPIEQIMAFYEQMERQAAEAGEHFVSSRGFASLLGQLAENTAALTKLSADAMDLVLRNLRVAGRRDIVRLAQQLARTEDKLERVLQEVELVREELAGRSVTGPAGPVANGNGAKARPINEARSARSAGAVQSGVGES
jgi:hypothetical protein